MKDEVVKVINVIVEKTKDGYSAYTTDYPICTVGNSMDEIKANILEAINLYRTHNKKQPVKMTGFLFKLDLSSFFELYPVINASALSKKVGMNKTLLSPICDGQKETLGKAGAKDYRGCTPNW
jgi:predicted RNase H-like HicB family nuclease